MRRAWLLPIVFVTYSLAYLDRANFGFGVAAGMGATLGLTPGSIALLSALFFAGYFAFQVPGMLLAQRTSCTRIVFVALLAWGALASLTGILRSFLLLALDRTLLGIAESIVFPAMLLLVARWFPRAQRSRANSILLLGNPVTVLWMSAFTGLLIDRLGWQRTFILEGLPAILWAFAWIALMPERPTQAAWLPRDEALALEQTIAAEQPALPHTSASSLTATLLSAQPLLLSLQYFFWSIGVYGFVLWLPTIVRRGASLSMGQTGLLSAIPYIFAIAALLLVSFLADRTQRRAPLVWPALALAGVFMLASFVAADRSFPLAFISLVLACAAMYAPYGAFFAMIPDRVAREATGPVFAMVNSAGALGGFAGSYLVGALTGLTHSQRAGDLLMSLSFFAASLLTLALLRAPSPMTDTTAHA